MNDTGPRINWDCEFFTGENERLLLAATLNTIELEDLPKFVKMLNEFLRLRPSQDDFVKDIVLNGCDDAVVRLTNGGTIEICGETTFQEILGLI